MIETVKRAAQSSWAPLLVAGLLGVSAVGGAEAASVTSIQRSYDEATGQVLPYSPENAAARVYGASSQTQGGACLQTSLSRRYNQC